MMTDGQFCLISLPLSMKIKVKLSLLLQTYCSHAILEDMLKDEF